MPALPPGLRYVAAAAGTGHSVLLRSDGESRRKGIADEMESPRTVLEQRAVIEIAKQLESLTQYRCAKELPMMRISSQVHLLWQ